MSGTSKDNSSKPMVFREWSPYGGPDVPNPRADSSHKTKNNKDVIFKGWSSASNAKEADKLEQASDHLRRQLHELRENGRQIRLHRLQALDALETRRVTLTEILRRMEKELNDRDVYEYGDVLAEVFGERKIFAHRAVGLEALLCQYMHQMLAKQHQLKIMKRVGKDIEGHYRKSKHNIKDSFHSYEALCVQLEASRLSLEDIYDDIFASQHRILAHLKRVESGENTTNYSIPSPASGKNRKELTMKVSSKHPFSDAGGSKELQASNSGDRSLTDEFADLLSNPKEQAEGLVMDDEMKEEHLIKTAAETRAAILANPSLRTNTNTSLHSIKANTASANDPPSSSRRSPEDGKTARERRREIEKKRMATPSRISAVGNNNSYASAYSEEEEGQRSRNRMRELEAKASANS